MGREEWRRLNRSFRDGTRVGVGAGRGHGKYEKMKRGLNEVGILGSIPEQTIYRKVSG